MQNNAGKDEIFLAFTNSARIIFPMILINPNTQQAHKVNSFLGSIEGFQSIGFFGGGSYPNAETSATMASVKWREINLNTNGTKTLFFNFDKMLSYVVDSSG